jgi:hypothetical protein
VQFFRLRQNACACASGHSASAAPWIINTGTSGFGTPASSFAASMTTPAMPPRAASSSAVCAPVSSPIKTILEAILNLPGHRT